MRSCARVSRLVRIFEPHLQRAVKHINVISTAVDQSEDTEGGASVARLEHLVVCAALFKSILARCVPCVFRRKYAFFVNDSEIFY